MFWNLEEKINFNSFLAPFKPYYSPQTPKKMGLSRIFVFAVSETTFLTLTHGLGHRMKANGPKLYIMHILCAEVP